MKTIKEGLKSQIVDELVAREGLTINSKDESKYHDQELKALIELVLKIEDRELKSEEIELRREEIKLRSEEIKLRSEEICVKETTAKLQFKASTIEALEGLGRTVAGAGLSWGMFVAALEAEQVAAIWSRTHKIVGEFLRPLKW